MMAAIIGRGDVGARMVDSRGADLDRGPAAAASKVGGIPARVPGLTEEESQIVAITRRDTPLLPNRLAAWIGPRS